MITNTINNDKTIAGSIGTMLAGRYHILRQLGEGGMGSVWLAEDRQLDNRKVAIKMLPSIVVTDKRAYQQLKSEALVSLKLVHPNIVTLRAFEENNGAPFLVMDYIEGQTLSDYLAVKGKLSEAETIKLLKPIAAALDYAHGEKVIHRDVKPSNIIIRKDGHPFILDFGIAREIQESMTRVTGRTISGTLLYMSPEQLRGASPTPAQDVYSFSAMCYECLKGEPPFTKGEIAYQITNELPTPLTEESCFSKLVMAGLAKKADDRPMNCITVLGVTYFSQKGASTCLPDGKTNDQHDRLSKKILFVVSGILVVVMIFLVCLYGSTHNNTNKPKTPPNAVEIPMRRSSLSKISWTYYKDEYYKHSIEERQKERGKVGKAGLHVADWANRCVGGAFFLKVKEEAENEYVEDEIATKNFSKVNDAFRDNDMILANSFLNDFPDSDFCSTSARQFLYGVLSECRGDIKAAHRCYQFAAEDWCKEALFNLGVFYEFGIGVQSDKELAAGYYQRAAIQGDNEALQRWQRLSGSEATLPDLKLIPIFDRRPWPDSSVLVSGTEFAALRDDVGRWWDVPFSKIKDFFEANDNQVDGKFFFNTGHLFVDDENNTVEHVGEHFEINRDQIRNFEKKDAWPAVEVWNGKTMYFDRANDVQAVRNIVLYYTLVTGKDVFTEMNSGKKFEEVVTIEMANCDDGKGIMPLHRLMTESQRLSTANGANKTLGK